MLPNIFDWGMCLLTMLLLDVHQFWQDYEPNNQAQHPQSIHGTIS